MLGRAVRIVLAFLLLMPPGVCTCFASDHVCHVEGSESLNDDGDDHCGHRKGVDNAECCHHHDETDRAAEVGLVDMLAIDRMPCSDPPSHEHSSDQHHRDVPCHSPTCLAARTLTNLFDSESRTELPTADASLFPVCLGAFIDSNPRLPWAIESSILWHSCPLFISNCALLV
jgi:hypothetical protein